MDLSLPQRKAYSLVEKHYTVPSTFENSRAFGPKSGVCYEERVMSAYCQGLLEAKGEAVEICLRCGVEGHVKGCCPEGL